MRVLIIDNFVGKAVIKETGFIPRLGDRLDLFYEPYPTVDGLLIWPTEKTLEPFSGLGLDLSRIDAVITTGGQQC